jgi:hypothetical protein
MSAAGMKVTLVLMVLTALVTHGLDVGWITVHWSTETPSHALPKRALGDSAQTLPPARMR